ncbi:MAG: hypothetical protein HQK50_13190 [Oligoflexia bacterium]|nr:hypothetical protein [Oligoflexia bacterium]MBF0366521.1 hypothetical protein [Oligoflexia bacterium]
MLKITGIIVLGMLLVSCSKKEAAVQKEVATPLPTAEAMKIAKVSAFENEVKRRQLHRIEWEGVNALIDLYQRDSLQTMEKSTASVLFDDGSGINIGEKSLVVIARPERVVNDIDTEIELTSGQVQRTFNTEGRVIAYGSKLKTGDFFGRVSSDDGGAIGVKFKDQRVKYAAVKGEVHLASTIDRNKEGKELVDFEAAKGKGKIKLTINQEKESSVVSKIEVNIPEGRVGLDSRRRDDVKLSVFKGNVQIEATLYKNKNRSVNVAKIVVYDGKSNLKMNLLDDSNNVLKSKNFVVKARESLSLEVVEGKNDVSVKKKEEKKEELKHGLQEYMSDEEDIAAKQEILRRIGSESGSSKEKEKREEGYLAKVVGIEAYFRWPATSGAQKYIVDISSSELFDIILETKVEDKNSTTVDLSKYSNKSLYWRVAPVVGGEARAYTATQLLGR